MGERSRTATVALPRQRTGTRPAVVGVALDRRAGAGGPLPPAVATAASLAAAWRSAARADQVPAGIPGLSGRRRTAAGRSPGRVAKRFGATLGPGGVGLVTAAVDAVVARHFAAAPAAHAGLFLALALVGLLLPSRRATDSPAPPGTGAAAPGRRRRARRSPTRARSSPSASSAWSCSTTSAPA
ncbi:hypothetical protein ACFQZC_34675 [Streptacidiphilus monticola]